MSDPVVYLVGGFLGLVGAVAATVGTRRGKESDVAVSVAAEAREWAEVFRVAAAASRAAEDECRSQLALVRSELEELRRTTTALIAELRSELDRIQGDRT